MNMKKYWKLSTLDFANTYDIVWTDSEEMEKFLPPLARRITRKEAEHLCTVEKDRREYDSAFSGSAPVTIRPADNIGEEYNINKYFLNGYIWEKRPNYK